MSARKPAVEPEPPENDDDVEDDGVEGTGGAGQRAPAIGAPAHATALEGSALDQRLAEYAKLGFPIAVALGGLAAGVFLGPAPAVLVLAGGALVVVISLFWSSLRTLLGETPLSGADAYALGAPRAEEEQKQAVLRALKDLEFERGVGKISDEDYRELVTKYRAEAKRLLRILDEEAQPRRRQVEALVARHLRGLGLGDGELEESPAEEPAQAEARGEADDDDDDRDEAAPRACAACGTTNDADAVFCKKCGAKQQQEQEEEK